MQIQFSVIPACKCKKKDIIAAIDIYCKTVDPGSFTDTNQIKDYIFNPKSHKDEARSMFFYLLFGSDNTVEGFAELAYLPENQVLVLDYICTTKRSNVQFYSFYSLLLQDIEAVLNKQSKFIRYVITELSLNKSGGKLVDRDSNYFRHLLSGENYHLLKYPYYQPPLSNDETAQEFNLAIKLLNMDSNDSLTLPKEKYVAIVGELYYSHYVAWYQNNNTFNIIIDGLFERIKSEILNNMKYKPFVMVQCQLFEDGQCPKLTVENYTIPRAKKKKRKKYITILCWIIFSALTFVISIFSTFSKLNVIACSFFTILSGVLSVFSLRKEIFGR